MAEGTNLGREERPSFGKRVMNWLGYGIDSAADAAQQVARAGAMTGEDARAAAAEWLRTRIAEVEADAERRLALERDRLREEAEASAESARQEAVAAAASAPSPAAAATREEGRAL